MNEQREMTLNEWCARLRPEHTVNRDLARLLSEIDRLTGELAEAGRDAVIPQEIREYLVAASEGSMSRNNSEQMASELLIKLDTAIAAQEGRK